MGRAGIILPDPDSAIVPNKEGGYAPDFNPVAAVAAECGMIVDADLLNEMTERKKEVAEKVAPAEGWLTELPTPELKELFALRKKAVAR